MHRLVLFVLTIGGSLLLNGPVALGQPKWATQPPPGTGLYLYGVGIAHASKDGGDQQRADDVARADIVRQLRVTVSSRLTSITTETSSGGVSYDTKQIVESSVSFTLEGIEIKERFYDKKRRTYYALARLNRQTASERVGSVVHAAAQRAAAYVNQADRLRVQGSLYQQFLILLQAADERASVEIEESVFRALSAGSSDALLDRETGTGSPFSPTLDAIDREIGALVTGLTFQNRSGDHQAVRRGRVAEPLIASLEGRASKGTVPAPGFPILFRVVQGYGKLEWTNPTPPDGVVKGVIQRVVPGGETRSVVVVSVDTTAVRSQAPARQIGRWLARLGDVQTRFSLDTKEFGFEDGIAELAYRLVQQTPDTMTMVVGKFTYQDTRIAGPVTGSLRQLLSSELADLEKGRLIEAPALSAKTVSYGDPDAMETLARSAQADGVVWGEYWEKGDSVVVYARLTDRTGARQASADVVIPASSISQTLRPPSLDVDLPKPPANGIPIHLWTDRGDGGLYRAGEELVAYAQTETDGYLRLLYRQADGQLLQIFPNHLSGDDRVVGGQVYSIPDTDAPYRFVVQAPYGVEYLIALTSTTPFPPVTGKEINGGVALSGKLRDVIQRLTSGRTWYGQTIYRMTTTQP